MSFMNGSNGKKYLDSHKLSNREKYFNEVQTYLLSIALGYKEGFVLVYASIKFIFDFINPFVVNRVFVLR